MGAAGLALVWGTNPSHLADVWRGGKGEESLFPQDCSGKSWEPWGHPSFILNALGDAQISEQGSASVFSISGASLGTSLGNLAYTGRRKTHREKYPVDI